MFPFFLSDDDSLDIKPPQAKSEFRYKDKKKHKKHSHDRKYKDKNRDYSREDPEHRRRHDDGKNYHKDRDYYKQQRDSRGEYRSESRKEDVRTPDEPSKSDSDRKLEEDLRNRLLSRRGQKDFYEPRGGRSDEFYKRKDKHRGDYYSRDKREPDYIEDYEQNRSRKHRSHQPPVDAEAEARIKKFLEYDRDEIKRKEKARQELEARRELLRKETTSCEVSLSPEPKKKRYESSEERQKPAEDVVMLSSEQSHGEEEIDSESDSHTSQHSKESEEFEMSPIPVEQLEKSDHRKHRSQSGSKTRSPTKSRSISRSKSHESHSSVSTRTSSHSSNTHSESESGSEHSDGEKKKASDLEIVKAEEPLKPVDESKEEAVESKEEELPSYFPALQGCRSVEEFQCLNRIEEGTYGVVYRAKDKRSDEVVALKRLKMEKEKEGFPITSLREINTLLKGQHPNIVTVREIVVGSNMDKIFIVMDYVEHDLKSLIETMKHKKQVFLPGEVKCLIQQLIKAVAHLHDNWILHRDLKTSNLLLSHKGILKVGDFGLAREYGSPLKEYTSIVVTLWYRAPELLLGCKEYSCHIDVWSVGCIFAELLAMTALFPGKSEVDQLNRIFKDLGTPNERVWPGYDQLPLVKKMTFTDYPVSQLRKKFATLTSELGLSLLQGLLTYDPKQRLTAEMALKHSYFKEMPLPIDPAMFPTWPAKSEVGWKRALVTSPKPPSGGMQFKKLVCSTNNFFLNLFTNKLFFSQGVDDENSGFSLSATYASYSESRKMQMGSGFSLKF